MVFVIGVCWRFVWDVCFVVGVFTCLLFALWCIVMCVAA